MIYCIWGLLGIITYIRKNSRLALLAMFAFIMVVFCFNTDNPDLLNYKAQYNGTVIFGREPLFYLLNRFFYHAGVSYQVFRLLLVLSGLSLMTVTFCRLSPYPAWMLFLYSIYPMTIDVVQIRFFMAYSIVLYGMTFLIDYQINHRITDILLYFACILLGTSFHFAVILYLVLGLLFLDYKRFPLLYVVLIPAGMMAAFFLLPRLAAVIALFIGNHKAGLWIQKEKISSIQHILRVILTRAMPVLYALIISFLMKNVEYVALFGGSVNSTGLSFHEGDYADRSMSEEYGFYDLRVNRCLFLSVLYIFTFSMLEVTIASNYERIARMGLLLGAILVTRQQKCLTQSNRMVSHLPFLFLYILYFISIMYFSREKQGMLFIKYVFGRVMENNSLLGTGF